MGLRLLIKATTATPSFGRIKETKLRFQEKNDLYKPKSLKSVLL